MSSQRLDMHSCNPENMTSRKTTNTNKTDNSKDLVKVENIIWILVILDGVIYYVLLPYFIGKYNCAV